MDILCEYYDLAKIQLMTKVIVSQYNKENKMKKMIIETKEAFSKYIAEVQAKESFPKTVLGWAIVREVYGQINPDKVLMSHVPVLNWNNSNLGSLAVLLDV